MLQSSLPPFSRIVLEILLHTKRLPKVNSNAFEGSSSATLELISPVSIIDAQAATRSTTPRARFSSPLTILSISGYTACSQNTCASLVKRSVYPGGNKLTISSRTLTGLVAWIWVTKKLMIMTNANIILEYERFGTVDRRLPADVNNEGVAGLADVAGAGAAGQPLGAGGAPGRFKEVKEKGWPVPGSVPENPCVSTVAFCAVVTVVRPACCESAKEDWKLGEPGQVTPLLQWVPAASVVQVRLGKFADLRLSQDGPPQVRVTATGMPKPQSIYTPFALEAMTIELFV